MRLGVRPMGGKIGGNCVDFILDTLQSDFHAVDFFGEHLVAFNDKVELMLEILGHDTDMMFEVFRHFTDMMPEKLIDLFDIFCVHGTSAVVKIPVFFALLLFNVNGFSGGMNEL
jgi:hypothetical protein